VPIDRQAYKPKNAKVSQKGRGVFRNFLYISGMGKATDLKFSMRTELKAGKPKKRKSRSIGACPALRDLFLNLGYPPYLWNGYS